ncbi:MAG: hypothetical protein AAF723_00915 [Pseudomonadota bacterium]
MPTSDGISDSDWDLVQQQAEYIADANLKGTDDRLLTSNLLQLLQTLERKYGRLPSLLATQADFVPDKTKELSLLKEAYIISMETNDNKNKTYISDSIVQWYLDNGYEKEILKFWLDRLLDDLKNHKDTASLLLYEKGLLALSSN